MQALQPHNQDPSSSWYCMLACVVQLQGHLRAHSSAAIPGPGANAPSFASHPPPPHACCQLFLPLRQLLVSYCASRGVAEAVALSFFQDMQRESFKHHDELLDKDKMEVAATRIWTSAQTLQCVAGSGGIEFCSLLNEVLRCDDAVRAGAAGWQLFVLKLSVVFTGDAAARLQHHPWH